MRWRDGTTGEDLVCLLESSNLTCPLPEDRKDQFIIVLPRVFLQALLIGTLCDGEIYEMRVISPHCAW